jgi:hypothetical protein
LVFFSCCSLEIFVEIKSILLLADQYPFSEYKPSESVACFGDESVDNIPLNGVSCPTAK